MNTKMMYRLIIIAILLCSIKAYAQVEHITIAHPVYTFLQKLENQNAIGKYNLNDLPLSKSRILEILSIAKEYSNISANDRDLIEEYMNEFDNHRVEATILIPSKTDSLSILSSEIYGNKQKYLYLYKDSSYFTALKPLGSLDIITLSNKESDKTGYSIIGNLGVRFSGSIDDFFGYSVQATNGVLFGGERKVASYDNHYSKNIKFIYYKDDIDFTESHLRFSKDWFNASLGREYRLIGAGYFNRFIVSDNSPSFDAITLGAEFSNFKYQFMHASLLGFVNKVGGWETGFHISIPSKYMAMHRFSINGEWGELSLFEQIIYSDRQMDLAYLNPISFFKSLEHSLRDRDNAGIGFDFNIKTDLVQIKGTYFMDDVKFEEIGNGYWGNKSAWNLGVATNLLNNIDLRIEYARVEPYTFSHFNRQNSLINDGYMISSYLNPNSDRISIGVNYWFGSKHPIDIEYSYTRHGKNIIDSLGNIIKNVGGDPYWTKREIDSESVVFLDGDGEFANNLKISYAYEFIRNFTVNVLYNAVSTNSNINHYIRFILKFDNF
ncbi:MAG TPA: hypothetical protein PLE30_00415 [Candidatus Kapabacteria bacterium]|nr:hypothetical protein [Candidatus Kapabacteria bacterium]